MRIIAPGEIIDLVRTWIDADGGLSEHISLRHARAGIRRSGLDDDIIPLPPDLSLVEEENLRLLIVHFGQKDLWARHVLLPAKIAVVLVRFADKACGQRNLKRCRHCWNWRRDG